MAGEQHNDHCTVQFPDGTTWFIRKVEGQSFVMTCACGCSLTRMSFPADFDFVSFCNNAAMRLAGAVAREERGGLPVSAGSEARN